LPCPYFRLNIWHHPYPDFDLPGVNGFRWDNEDTWNEWPIEMDLKTFVETGKAQERVQTIFTDYTEHVSQALNDAHLEIIEIIDDIKKTMNKLHQQLTDFTLISERLILSYCLTTLIKLPHIIVYGVVVYLIYIR
jgi:hypothetical protein